MERSSIDRPFVRLGYAQALLDQEVLTAGLSILEGLIETTDDAEDLVQAFFAHAVSEGFFASYDPERGRFRTFFRVCVDRFVSNEEKAKSRVKRGGDATMVSFDFHAAEAELAGGASPDDVFDR